MSEQQEQPTGYMAELDRWTEEAILALLDEDGFLPGAETALQICKAIRTKVLESYKNGIKAGFAKAHQGARKEPKHAPAQTR